MMISNHCIYGRLRSNNLRKRITYTVQNKIITVRIPIVIILYHTYEDIWRHFLHFLLGKLYNNNIVIITMCIVYTHPHDVLIAIIFTIVNRLLLLLLLFVKRSR